ncbi:mitoguardin [Anthonomus grandis grandis]|uniref:mitoguardin n=1 Tax=Anthonomus grandis grandis TaxID=2921223 RepID=UPI0021661D29|nr:mitoguardin [Anthonomus grandis grandis]
MSLLAHLGPAAQYLSNLKQLLPQKISLSTTQKVIIVSVGASIVVVGSLARYLRRKKHTINPARLRRNNIGGKRSRASTVRSPNDMGSIASSGRRSNAYSNIYGERYTRQGSAIASTRASTIEKASVVSSSLASGSVTIAATDGGGDDGVLTPQQLGVMGMEALESCISCWEDALAIYRTKDGTGGPLPMLSPEEAGFCRDLQLLLDSALELQENSEMLFLDERSVLFRPESSRERENGLDTDLSGGESFASAQDQVADLKEFEEFSDYFPDLESYPLYQMALRQLENGGIPCRTLRTEVVKCGSDGEYLAKLHCLRLAFQHLLRDPANYCWFADAGRQILVNLMLYADRDPKDFLIAYEEILQFIQDPGQWRDLEEELSTRGVKALTFYDVVLDYILMDAFEDLESPPSSVMAVIQNRWLSKGFKETALTTAVWSVLKAKRRRLKFPNGFMAHFYAISEQLSPLLAWGFLGSDESLRETCVFFKEQVMGFLSDIFCFQKCRFVTVDDLAADVYRILRVRVENVCQRLCVPA